MHAIRLGSSYRDIYALGFCSAWRLRRSVHMDLRNTSAIFLQFCLAAPPFPPSQFHMFFQAWL